MANATRICKICGKEYPYCHTDAFDRFRWQDVACCPEHGSEYFAAVLAARAADAERAKAEQAKVEEAEAEKARGQETDEEENIKDLFDIEDEEEFEDDEEEDDDEDGCDF